MMPEGKTCFDCDHSIFTNYDRYRCNYCCTHKYAHYNDKGEIKQEEKTQIEVNPVPIPPLESYEEVEK